MIGSVRIAVVLVLVGHGLAAAAPSASLFHRVWVHAGVNFQLDDDTDRFISLMRRAKSAGYNGVVFGDAKLARPVDERPPRYWANVERASAAAEETGIELIPKVAPLSWANSMLANNPHLAEGIPVRDCLFQVRGGKATVAEGQDLLPFGTFEEFQPGDRPSGWDWFDGPGKSLFADRSVKHSGNASARLEGIRSANEHGLGRLYKKLKLKPWHQYHLRLWIKTQDFDRPETIRVMLQTDVEKNPRFELNRQSLGVRQTQDWRQHDVVFNTFGRSEVWLYVGTWGGNEGKFWIDDVSLRQTAGINLLRREGCPISVSSEDGQTVYREGVDFERWEYPQMGRVPYAGIYAVHPEPPIVLAEKSRIRDGQRLKVSFYHTLTLLDGSATLCLCSDGVFEQHQRHIRLVKKLFPQTKTWLLTHDELRLAGWCGLCDSPDRTAGQLLAEHVQRVTQIIRGMDPQADVVVWSDMYDPFHNAVDRYWLTRGTMKGSWVGLDRDVLVGNWNGFQRDASLAFFAQRGHRQLIAAYYDRQNWEQATLDWLKAAEKVEGIDGIIYTTWRGDYDNLEKFIELINRHGKRQGE